MVRNLFRSLIILAFCIESSAAPLESSLTPEIAMASAKIVKLSRDSARAKNIARGLNDSAEVLAWTGGAVGVSALLIGIPAAAVAEHLGVPFLILDKLITTTYISGFVIEGLAGALVLSAVVIVWASPAKASGFDPGTPYLTGEQGLDEFLDLPEDQQAHVLQWSPELAHELAGLAHKILTVERASH